MTSAMRRISRRSNHTGADGWSPLMPAGVVAAKVLHLLRNSETRRSMQVLLFLFRIVCRRGDSVRHDKVYGKNTQNN
jgi:hypothetical protein